MWPQVFKIRPVKAWSAVVTSVVAMAASLYCIAIAPWYLLPFAWAFSGTAFTGVRPLLDLLPGISAVVAVLDGMMLHRPARSTRACMTVAAEQQVVTLLALCSFLWWATTAATAASAKTSWWRTLWAPSCSCPSSTPLSPGASSTTTTTLTPTSECSSPSSSNQVMAVSECSCSRGIVRLSQAGNRGAYCPVQTEAPHEYPSTSLQ